MKVLHRQPDRGPAFPKKRETVKTEKFGPKPGKLAGKRTALFFIFCALMISVSPLPAQVSLWNDRNIYAENYRAGDVIEVFVREHFTAKVSGKWGRQVEVEFNVVPDKKNLPFLPDSEQSRNNTSQTKEEQKVSEKLEFKIAGVLGEGGPAGLFTLEARKQISLDGRVSSMILTGLVDPKQIKNRTVQSSDIFNLTLNVTTAPPVFRDTTVDAEAAGQEPAGDQFRWRQADKDRLLLNHIREIVGGLR